MRLVAQSKMTAFPQFSTRRYVPFQIRGNVNFKISTAKLCLTLSDSVDLGDEDKRKAQIAVIGSLVAHKPPPPLSTPLTGFHSAYTDINN